MVIKQSIKGPARDRWDNAGPVGFVMLREHNPMTRPACWKLSHLLNGMTVECEPMGGRNNLARS